MYANTTGTTTTTTMPTAVVAGGNRRTARCRTGDPGDGSAHWLAWGATRDSAGGGVAGRPSGGAAAAGGGGGGGPSLLAKRVDRSAVAAATTAIILTSLTVAIVGSAEAAEAASSSFAAAAAAAARSQYGRRLQQQQPFIINEGIRCRCDYTKHEANVQFVCMDDNGDDATNPTPTFVVERPCDGVVPITECEPTIFDDCGSQLCYAGEAATFAYGDWIGGCKFPHETLGETSLNLCPYQQRKEIMMELSASTPTTEDNASGNVTTSVNRTALISTPSSNGAARYYCTCNDSNNNRFVDCSYAAAVADSLEEGDETHTNGTASSSCVFARLSCSVHEVCSSSSETFPYRNWRDACLDNTQSKDKEGDEGETTASDEVPAADENNANRGGATSSATTSTTTTAVTLKGKDAFYYCMRPKVPGGESNLQCEVTSIADWLQHPQDQDEESRPYYSIGFGIFGLPYQHHRGPFYRRVLQHNLRVGDVFSSDVSLAFHEWSNLQSYGLLLDIAAAGNATATAVAAAAPAKWDTTVHSRMVFSDDYLNGNGKLATIQDGVTAEYVPDSQSTRITFLDTRLVSPREYVDDNDTTNVLVQLECTGMVPLIFFYPESDHYYQKAKEKQQPEILNSGVSNSTNDAAASAPYWLSSCEQDAIFSYNFRETVWPPSPPTEAQVDFVFAIVSLVTGFLSLIGSSFIVFATVYKWWRFSISSTRERLLLGMSCIDMMSSTALMLGPIPTPSGAMSNVKWAFGNEATCNAQGFATQMGFAVPLYISVLCVYYVLVLVFFCDSSSIRRFWEAWFHFIPLAFGITTASMGVGLGLYGTNGRRCWIANSPWDCYWNDIIDCKADNWEHFKKYQLVFGAVPVVLSFCVIFISMSWISIKVVGNHRNTPMRRKTREQQDGNTSTLRISPGEPAGAPPNIQVSARQNDMTWPILIQASLFIGAFVVTYVWLFPVYIGENTTFNHPAWVEYAVHFFWPLQGFFNAFIFVRPTYARVRARHSEWWFPKVLWVSMMLESVRANVDINGRRRGNNNSRKSTILLKSLAASQRSSAVKSSSFDYSKENVFTDSHSHEAPAFNRHNSTSFAGEIDASKE